MNLTSFLGCRLKLKTLAIIQQWPYGSQHSTTYHPSLDMLWGRASILLLLSDQNGQYNRRRVPRQSDASRTLILGLQLRLIYTLLQPNRLEDCVLHFLLLLGNTTMFVCKLPIRLLLEVGCVCDVFHASLTSDFFGWACWILSPFNGSWVVVWSPSALNFLDVVENTFALLQTSCQAMQQDSDCW